MGTHATADANYEAFLRNSKEVSKILATLVEQADGVLQDSKEAVLRDQESCCAAQTRLKASIDAVVRDKELLRAAETVLGASQQRLSKVCRVIRTLECDFMAAGVEFRVKSSDEDLPMGPETSRELSLQHETPLPHEMMLSRVWKLFTMADVDQGLQLPMTGLPQPDDISYVDGETASSSRNEPTSEVFPDSDLEGLV